MSEFPSLPLFVDAYISDTEHLSDAEHGRYLKLLMMMWRSPECRIPNDDEWLARRFRRTVEEVRRDLRPLIAEFCACDGNWIIQRRLRSEWEWCVQKSRKNSASAKSRWNKEKEVSERNAPIPSPIKNSGSVETRAREQKPAVSRETPSVSISSAAIDLAGELTVLANADRDDPGWCGAALRVQLMLDQGVAPEVMRVAVRKVAKNARDGPPFAYFEKPIMREHARSTSPLPQFEIVNQPTERVHVARPSGSVVQAADRALDLLDRWAVGPESCPPALGNGAGAAHVRLLPARRSG